MNTAARKTKAKANGFTMVEIALSLAVVAFALVAIMGVLPTGMTVGKDNREDTLINQEGRYWLEAIKNGAMGLDELTNYVEYIKIERAQGSTNTYEFKNEPATPFTSVDIIALVSMEKYTAGPTTNRITARLRPITGAAADRVPMRGTTTNDLGFRYQMGVEIVPAVPTSLVLMQDIAAQTGDDRPLFRAAGIATNLWDVRLIMRWPVVERGNDFYVGNGRKTFRARIAGRPTDVAQTNLSAFVKADLPNLKILKPN